MIPYFYSPVIAEIQSLFASLPGFELAPKNNHLIKSEFFRIFKSDEFIDLYSRLAREIVDDFFPPDTDVRVQATPMPRIFFPKSHGTSFHTDYWYGHGLTTYTVWLPLFNCITGATFFSDHNNSLGIDTVNDPSLNPLSSLFIDKLCTPLFEVLPPYSSCYIFPSHVLHGSVCNNTSVTRLSFDFRITSANDSTSTKDFSDHLLFSNSNLLVPNKHPLHGKSVLKYIIGGQGSNAQIQLQVIETMALKHGVLAHDQEREIERYHYPVLRKVIEDKTFFSQYEAIAVMSLSQLPQEAISLIASSEVPFWSCYDNRLLNY